MVWLTSFFSSVSFFHLLSFSVLSPPPLHAHARIVSSIFGCGGVFQRAMGDKAKAVFQLSRHGQSGAAEKEKEKLKKMTMKLKLEQEKLENDKVTFDKIKSDTLGEFA